MPDDRSWMHTAMGSTTPETITVCGMDLADDIMGKISFPDLAFRMVAGRLPDERESRLFNAVLVSLADHGITPTVLAARLTYLGAPEALQGAVAAGLLGGGSVFLGVAEDAARFLGEVLATVPAAHHDDEVALRTAAGDALARLGREGRRTPGLGHPVHKVQDPRTPVLIRIAEEEGLRGPHLRLFEAIGRVHPAILGRTLPLNGAGVCGAALADLGLPVEMLRGFALLARAAGLLGHLAEERRTGLGLEIYRTVDRNARYVTPDEKGLPHG